jgi:recA bacterial DNA recombination protein
MAVALPFFASVAERRSSPEAEAAAAIEETAAVSPRDAECTAIGVSARPRPSAVHPESPSKSKALLEIAGVFRGRELTRKERHLECGIAPVDRLIGGGIVRGRISEIIGNPGAGKTSLAAAFTASVTGCGEVTAWIDAGGGFDPASMAAAGVDLARMLWVALPAGRHAARRAGTIVLKAAEWILAAGGFGLVVIDCGAAGDFDGRLGAFTQSAALRLARGAERSGAAVLVLAPYRMCGTFAALSLTLSRNRACFSRASGGAPMLFDGLTVEARVARNKLGGSGGAASWSALADPAIASGPTAASSPDSTQQADWPAPTHFSGTAHSAGRRVAAR